MHARGWKHAGRSAMIALQMRILLQEGARVRNLMNSRQGSMIQSAKISRSIMIGKIRLCGASAFACRMDACGRRC